MRELVAELDARAAKVNRLPPCVAAAAATAAGLAFAAAPDQREVVAFRKLGGLRHLYTREAA